MIVNKIGHKVITFIEKFLFFFEKDIAIHTLDQYSFLNNIIQNYSTIQKELIAFNLANFKNMEDLSVEQSRIIEQQKWKVLFLKIYGKPLKQNNSFFKQTEKLLQHKSIKTAMFSSLKPNAHIKPHRGPYKGVLRLHLGLLIPREQEKCAIKINNSIYHWQEGKAILFDDTYEHEAWNYATQERIILFLDIERTLQFPLNLINKLILKIISFSPFVKGIYANS